jgi:hypothetical protein
MVSPVARTRVRAARHAVLPSYRDITGRRSERKDALDRPNGDEVDMRRRRFLVLLVAAAATVAVGGFVTYRNRSRLRRALNLWSRNATRLPASPTGPLDERTLRALLATVETLLAATPIGTDQLPRYQDFFRWRAAHIPGLRDLYTQFAAALDARARGMAKTDFAGCDAATRKRVLAAVVPDHSPVRRIEKLESGTTGRARWLFRIHVVESILQLFAHTDAIRQLGYPDWPGVPRGLDEYRRAPQPAPAS